MKKILLIISAPLLASAALLVMKYAVWGQISLFWALSPLWLTACAAVLVFYAVWLNIAWQRWRIAHGRKICRNCMYCSLAEVSPGRHVCINTLGLDEVPPTQKACENFTPAIRK